ncbi:MAG: ATP-binding protein [Candidatus Limiplasma sp.]|nr:ATP-binding protein [Candidatus Limiplasma sp.]
MLKNLLRLAAVMVALCLLVGGAYAARGEGANLAPTGGPQVALTEAQTAYLHAHPSLTIAYGKYWEPAFWINSRGMPSGYAALLLARMAEALGLTLQYVPLETADRYDVLCCVPADAAVAAHAQVRLTQPVLTLPLLWIAPAKLAQAPASAAVCEGLNLNALRGLAAGELHSYPGVDACLDAVLTGEQPAALLNSYAAYDALESVRYYGLQAQPTGLSVSLCMATPVTADPMLDSILNSWIAALDTAERNDLLITAVLAGNPIDLGAIAGHLQPDVALALGATLAVVAALLLLLTVRGVHTRRERARTSEITAFLDYANRANEDVWEVDLDTRRRWRYEVQKNEIERTPMPPLTEDVIRRYTHPDDLALVLRRVQTYAQTPPNAPLWKEHFECRLLTDEGDRYKWERIVFQRIQPNREHPNSIMVYVMDVDDAIRAEEEKSRQLREALAVARAASEAKGEFTAYISHEIRSPLNALLGYLTLARSYIGDAQQLSDCFVKSEYAANHLLQLINDVLDMGAIESGKLQIAANRFDLETLLETLAAIYNAQARNRGLLYSVEGAEQPERYLIGDDLRLKQVLANLLSNAMKFTPRGGTVTLRARQETAGEGRVRMLFSVADTGAGMTESFQKQLFQPFTQQDANVAARYGGSGLGLNIAKHLTDLMGGTITVVSAPGQGSTFTVALTLPVDTTKRELTERQPDARAYFQGMRLLLVEDNDMNMEIASELLKQAGGFLIETAANGREAVDRFTAAPAGTFDAILMDVRMPVMDGYEATRAIRASERADAASIPILAMTADAFASDILMAKEAGMNGHISKPIDIHRVLLTLSDVLCGESGEAEPQTHGAELPDA